MSDNEIRCPMCGRLLGKIEGNKVVIIHGDRSSKVHGQGVVELDCDKVHGHIPCPGKCVVELPSKGVTI